MNPGLPTRVNIFTASVALAGLLIVVFLGVGEDWSLSIVAGTAFFMSLIVVTGSFPLPVAPKPPRMSAPRCSLAAPFCWSPG